MLVSWAYILVWGDIRSEFSHRIAYMVLMQLLSSPFVAFEFFDNRLQESISSLHLSLCWLEQEYLEMSLIDHMHVSMSFTWVILIFTSPVVGLGSRSHHSTCIFFVLLLLPMFARIRSVCIWLEKLKYNINEHVSFLESHLLDLAYHRHGHSWTARLIML